MFDELEKKQTTNNIPPMPTSVSAQNNLGKEPQDIFANVGDLGTEAPSQIPKPPVFQPKKFGEITLPGGEPQSEPGRKKIVLAGIIVVVIVLFFIGLWYGYYVLLPKFTDKNASQISNEKSQTDNIINPAVDENRPMEQNQTPPVSDTTPPADQAAVTTTPAQSEVQPIATGTPANIGKQDGSIDTDSDGLTDAEEKQLGTNINSSDSDGDGLFDREEAKVYKTNPLDPDTDKDGYQDGAEVKGGYNPNGTGKLYEIKN
jgi:hypothetical protein